MTQNYHQTVLML